MKKIDTNKIGIMKKNAIIDASLSQNVNTQISIQNETNIISQSLIELPKITKDLTSSMAKGESRSNNFSNLLNKKPINDFKDMLTKLEPNNDNKLENAENILDNFLQKTIGADLEVKNKNKTKNNNSIDFHINNLLNNKN